MCLSLRTRTAALHAGIGTIASLLAGAVLPLAFSPFDFHWLALAPIAVLFLLWLDAVPRRAALYGYAFGFGMFAVGASWVYVSIHEFGHTDLWVSLLLTILFVAGLALFHALLGWSVAWLAIPDRLRLLMVMPAAWTLFEWLRGWVLTGFPWLNLGYSQVASPFGGYAPVLGSYGVSYITVLGSALLLAALLFPGLLRYAAIVATVLLISAGWLLTGVEWTRPHGEPLRASLVQGNVSQHVKWNPQQRTPTLTLYRELTRRHWDSDLVIWPETAIPVFYHQVKDGYLSELAREAISQHTEIISGIVMMEPGTRRYYNSLVQIGAVSGFYHKRHLVPFGEYVPLASLLRGLIGFFNLPMSDFSKGMPEQKPLRVRGHDIGASICYEIAFGEEIIRALPGANLLVNVSNDAWFGESMAPRQHLQIARMRSLETGRPLLRATNTGISAVIDHRGRLQATAALKTRVVLEAMVQPMTGATPYVRLGNYPVVVMMLVLIGLAGGPGVRGLRISRNGKSV